MIDWKGFKFPKGSIIAFDRAYNDYNLFYTLTQDEVFFVSRVKKQATYKIIKQNSVSSKKNILADYIIKWQTDSANKKCPMKMRIVIVFNEEKNEPLTFITNQFTLSAATIAEIYKDRWEIELFFKTLKQHLRIKTFVGTTANALYTQIWTALIAVLLIKYMQFKAKMNWALSNLVALLRWNLFMHKNLWKWLDKPWEIPPGTSEDSQMKLLFRTASVKNEIK